MGKILDSGIESYGTFTQEENKLRSVRDISFSLMGNKFLPLEMRKQFDPPSFREEKKTFIEHSSMDDLF